MASILKGRLLSSSVLFGKRASVLPRNYEVRAPGSPSAPVTGPTPLPQPPLANLNALFLSATTFTLGTAASGTIGGGTAGSTLEVTGTVPSGLTLDLTARTWAWSGSGTANTGTFSLTESLTGAPNSPRISLVSWEVKSGAVIVNPPSVSPATVNPALAPLVLELVSAQTTFPVVIDILTDSDHAVGDTIWLYRRDKAGVLVETYRHTISLAEATDTTAGTEGRALFGISNVTSGTWRWTAEVVKADGLTKTPLSAVLVSGPDDQEPIFGATSVEVIGSTAAKLKFTTDSLGSGTVAYTPTGAAPSQAVMDAGVAFTVTATGPQEVALTDLEPSSTYFGWVQQEDELGNRTGIVPVVGPDPGGSFTTPAAGATYAKLYQGAAGANRHSLAIVSADGFTVSTTQTAGFPLMVRSEAALPPKFHMELEVGAYSGNIYFGIAGRSVPLGPSESSTAANIGISQPGLMVKAGDGSREIHFENGSQWYTGHTGLPGDAYIFDFDRSTPGALTFTLKRRTPDGTVTELVGNWTTTANVPSDPTIVVGVSNSPASVTLNVGQKPWLVPPLPDHTGITA